MSTSLPDPAAVLAIQAVLHRYATAIDERRWALLDEVFTADATIDFTAAGGPPQRSLDALRTWLQGSIGLVPVTRHHLSNIQVELEDGADAARSRTCLHNPLAGADGRVFLTVGGTYDDRWRRDEAGWRIRERTFTPTWFDGQLPDGITIGGTT